MSAYRSRTLRASCEAKLDIQDVHLFTRRRRQWRRCDVLRAPAAGLDASHDDTRRRTTRQTDAGGASSTEQEQAGPASQILSSYRTALGCRRCSQSTRQVNTKATTSAQRGMEFNISLETQVISETGAQRGTHHLRHR